MNSDNMNSDTPGLNGAAGRAVGIRPGDAWDLHIVALLIAQAFHHHAVAQWLVPDGAERRSVLYDVGAS